ncbi:MAG: YceD family protein [Rhodoblastus sp.]
MSKPEHPHEAPVWSSPLAVSEVPPQGADITIEADAAQRAALAKLNGLDGLASATAKLHVVPRGRERLHVTGEVRARVTQTCVVSLEPFESEIVEPVDVEFEPARAKPVREDPERTSRRRREARPPIEEDEEGMDDLDAPDEIVDGKVDLGALASEFLTLGIEPYPRKPGVAFAEPQPQGATVSPFARLAARKTEPGGER